MDAPISINLLVQTTIGAYQIGVLVSYVLFGVATAQAYVYYTRFPEDPRELKALVAVVWFCEMAYTFCIGHGLYVYTITGYGNVEVIVAPPPKSLDLALVFNGGVAACVQGFFSYRIYALSKKLYIPVPIWFMAFIRLLSCFVIFIRGFTATSMADYEADCEWLVTILTSISAATDWIITAALCYLLHNQRAHAPKKTIMLLDKLILWTILFRTPYLATTPTWPLG
ncbi:hypothetical protein K438DRAFT_1977308 [Mycena galopus ATCC 62051]|nr:hypothetical protein K438DRAFT_1977308 [Mycena galopus ATCC 62051]